MGEHPLKDELGWYWTCSDGELSSPSNYMAMVSAIRLGRASAVSQSATQLPDNRLQAAARARVISRSLSVVGAEDRSVLFAAFGPYARELPVFGAAAPVAALTTAARKAHQDSCSARHIGDWLVRLAWRVSKRQGNRLAEDLATASAINAEADQRLRKAIASFNKTRITKRK